MLYPVDEIGFASHITTQSQPFQNLRLTVFPDGTHFFVVDDVESASTAQLELLFLPRDSRRTGAALRGGVVDDSKSRAGHSNRSEGVSIVSLIQNGGRG